MGIGRWLADWVRSRFACRIGGRFANGMRRGFVDGIGCGLAHRMRSRLGVRCRVASTFAAAFGTVILANVLAVLRAAAATVVLDPVAVLR